MDKNPQVQAVYNLPRVKKFIDKKNRRSTKTGGSYLSALVKLNGYVVKEHNHNVDTIIDLILENKINVYDLLDGYVSYLPIVKEGITPSTIIAYNAALKSYFGLYDVDIVPSKFKNKVTLPRKSNEKEIPIDASDIRTILLSCHNRRLKAYLLVLCSSGMRADSEACSIRNCDIDFTSNPVKIHIRSDYTKTKVARDVYISDEATYHLKQWNQFKGNSNNEPESLVFAAYDNDIPHTMIDTKRIANNIYFRLSVEFAKLLTMVGMDQRKETGIIEKRRHRITLHSFRRFTWSIVNNQVNTAFADYICGHADSVYHTEKESVIKNLYLTRCMTALTVLDYKVLEETGKDHESRLKQKEQEIAVLKIKENQRDEEMAALNKKIVEMEQAGVKDRERLNDLVTLMAKERGAEVLIRKNLSTGETEIKELDNDDYSDRRDKDNLKMMDYLIKNTPDTKRTNIKSKK